MRIEHVKSYSGSDAKRIRLSLKLTQIMFAEFLGVSKKTVEAWEAGRNDPNGSVCRLLSMLENDPQLPERYLVEMG